MKRAVTALIFTLIAIVVMPARGHAQWGTIGEKDRLDPYEYQDVDDGQFLMFASYVLTPIGMGFEWGLMRPLHYLATETPLAPILSGDKYYSQFGQNDNADLVPPETFATPPMNFSNEFVPSPPEQMVVTSVVEEPIPPSPPTVRQPGMR